MNQPLGSMSVLGTVRGLHAALSELLERHADTVVMSSDIEAGLTTINALTLWDTSAELERGEAMAPLTLVLHCGVYPIGDTIFR